MSDLLAAPNADNHLQTRNTTNGATTVMSNNDENVPMDVTAEQAEAVMRAAISWAWEIPSQQEHKMTRHEWVLFEALQKYGDKFKGLRAQ